ncbi:MAG: hypothetical protein ABFC31_11885 [Clostridiaceae bacterium]
MILLLQRKSALYEAFCPEAGATEVKKGWFMQLQAGKSGKIPRILACLPPLDFGNIFR